jgi:hypothetical protein
LAEIACGAFSGRARHFDLAAGYAPRAKSVVFAGVHQCAAQQQRETPDHFRRCISVK